MNSQGPPVHEGPARRAGALHALQANYREDHP